MAPYYFLDVDERSLRHKNRLKHLATKELSLHYRGIRVVVSEYGHPSKNCPKSIFFSHVVRPCAKRFLTTKYRGQIFSFENGLANVIVISYLAKII